MNLLSKSKYSNFTQISLWLSVLAAAIASVVIFSWIFDTLYLIKINGDNTIIKFNAGLCFFASAVSLILVGKNQTKKIGLVIILFVLVLNLVNLCQHLFKFDAGIDEFFIKDHFTSPENFPGRMTANTSVFLVFTSLIIASVATSIQVKLAELLMTPLCVASLISLIGYFYLIKFPFEKVARMSPTTVTLCFLLSSSILFSRLESGFLAPFSQTTETARLNGKLLISGIFLTLLFGWLRLQGELSGFLRHDAGLLLMAAAFILILLYSNRVSTVHLNALEQKLKKEKELSEQIINSLPAIFFVTDKDHKFIRFNEYLVNASGFAKKELEKMTPLHFFPEHEQHKMLQYLQDIKEKGLMTIEASLKDKDGLIEPFFFKTMAIEYNGEPCLIGTGINITERKKAEQEIKLLNKQLRSLSNHLDNIREEERTSIAREIHDELGQQLTVFKINLAWLKSLPIEDEAERENLTTEMLALTESMIHSIRRIAHDLRPPALEDLGLAEALRIYSEEFELRTGISIHFFTELDMLDLSIETGKALYRIYQESLTNVARYANAQQVEASLDLEDENIILSISDNGVGFNIEELIHKKTLGIIGMRERAVMIGGKFEIKSQPNLGTTVLVKLPLNQEVEENENEYTTQTV